MTPVFCPANNVLDLGRLRLVPDKFSFSPAFVTMVAAGIQSLVNQLGSVSIVNLNLTAPATASDYVIYVGDGSGTMAREPNNTLRIAYVTPSGGYLFSTDTIRTVSHEFGHLLGLADRYYEGYQYGQTVVVAEGRKEDQVGQRVTVPMDGSLFSNETDYIPATNLMAGANPTWSLSQAQRNSMLACTDEPQFSRRVVGLFDSRGTSGSWPVPPTMYLSGGLLYAPDPPPPPDLRIVGYTLFGGTVFFAKAGGIPLGNGRVRALWNVRSWVDALGRPAKKIVNEPLIRGKRHLRRKGVVMNGPRIHRQMMKNIGNLAGL